MKTIHMEIALAYYFRYRQNLIVPNISWSFFLHREIDLFVLTKSDYAYEVEIKVSKHDLIKDKEKLHRHISGKIKRLYFAIPEYLEDHTEHIPQEAGIIAVNEDAPNWSDNKCELLRKPEDKSKYKFSPEERLYLYKLMAMRIWGLKEKISNQIGY